MKIKNFRKVMREAFQKVFEDQDRIRRHEDGYGDDLEEDQDRIRRHEDGYGDDLEEMGPFCPFRKMVDKEDEENKEDEKLEVKPLCPFMKLMDKEDEADEEFKNDAYDPVTDEDPMSLKKIVIKKLDEKAPPSEKAERFIQKNKENFKKRYGARWKEVLYATAQKMFPVD
jgi:predicted GNAT family acetyltransferase